MPSATDDHQFLHSSHTYNPMGRAPKDLWAVIMKTKHPRYEGEEASKRRKTYIWTHHTRAKAVERVAWLRRALGLADERWVNTADVVELYRAELTWERIDDPS